MTNIEKALSAGKLSPETVSSYVSKLDFARDVTGSKSFASMTANPRASFAKLRKHYSSDATLKQTLTAMLAGMRATNAPRGRLADWRTLHAAVSKKASEAHDGVITDTAKSTYECWHKIVAAEIRARNKHDTLRDSMDACLLSLVTRLPPKRADYGELRVCKKRPAAGNALVLPQSGNATLVLHDFKTAKSHGVLVETAPTALTSVLRASLKRWPRAHVFVTTSGTPMTPGAFGAFVKAATMRTVGKPIGPTMLRHIYISDVVTHGTEEFKDKTAASMLHSTKEQAQYVLTLPGGKPVCPRKGAAA
jgi:hypothetical protein